VQPLTSPYEYANGYISLDVPLIALPPAIDLGGTHYLVKPEFHISLIATKKITPLLISRDGISESDAEAKVANIACNIINDIKPKLTTIGTELRIADQPERSRRTLVVMADVSGLDEVFARLNHELRINVPTQVAHITLYALYGLPIGITSQDELKEKTRLLTDEETDELQSQIDIQQLVGDAL
jgi:hypothetical protein